MQTLKDFLPAPAPKESRKAITVNWEVYQAVKTLATLHNVSMSVMVGALADYHNATKPK